MRIKLVFIALALCTFSFAKSPLNVADILNETANVFKKDMDIKASFRSEQIMGEKVEVSSEGIIMIKNKRLKITTPSMLLWYDGKTEWVLVKENKEVNISYPTKEELFYINPYMFLDNYEKEYTSSVKESTLRGENCYDVTMLAINNKHKIKKILLSIDAKTKQLKCIRLLHENGRWMRITINNYSKNNHFSNNTFVYNPKEYPEVDQIDLR